MKNKAEKIMGIRPKDSPKETPLELELECPNSYLSMTSHWLVWSNLNGFVRCEGCKKDYPTCLCVDDVDKATNLFLSSVEKANIG